MLWSVAHAPGEMLDVWFIVCVNRCKILEKKDLGLTKVGKALNTRHRLGGPSRRKLLVSV